MSNSKSDSKVTKRIDMMTQILQKITEVCDSQKAQEEELARLSHRIGELEVIHDEQLQSLSTKLDNLELNMRLIREAQVSHGKVLAEMKQTCERRLFVCSGQGPKKEPQLSVSGGILTSIPKSGG
jgi:uncharacterized protein YydD (DUF2326 family)